MEAGQLCRVWQKGSTGKMAEQGKSKSLGSAVLTELLPRLGAHTSVVRVCRIQTPLDGFSHC